MYQKTDPGFWQQVSEALTFDTLYAWHVWVLIAIACLVIEMLTPGFVVACLAVGAIGAGIADLIGYNDFKLQLAVFAGTTFLSFFALRPALKEWLLPDDQKTNVDALIDRDCTVTGAAEVGGIGQVRIGAEEWRAEHIDGGPLEIGADVRVVRIEGNRAIVRVIRS